MIHASPSGISLALGGGAARGLAHLGVLEIFEREEIPVACIAGTSMGGLLGAIWASGRSAPELIEEVGRKAKWKQVVRLLDLDLSLSGLMGGRRLEGYLDDLLVDAKTFRDLRVPLALTAIDMRTGTLVTLREGRLLDAMRATMSVPGVFSPVELNGMRLIDGGLLSNVPAKIARSLGGCCVVAVDVMPSFAQNEPGRPPVVPPLELGRYPAVVAAIVRAEHVMISALTEAELSAANPEVIVRPAIHASISAMTGFTRVHELIECGRNAAEDALPEIRRHLA